MELGPTQVLVFGLASGELEGWIFAELRRLRQLDAVRLVDLLVVQRNEDGSAEKLERGDLPPREAAELGALAGALLGLDTQGAGAAAPAPALSGDQVWYLADRIPPNTTAAIALLEHRWAIPLRDAVEASGVVTLADSWIHPDDLAAVGAERSPG